MKEVRIACPRCQANNTIDLATLKSNGGHVLCHACNFVFKVVPTRNSATTAPASIHEPTAPHPNTQKLASAIQAISAAVKAKQAALPPIDSTFLPINTPSTETPTPTSAPTPLAQQHNHTVPSINILLKQVPAPVAANNWNHQQLPFDLLDPVPSVSNTEIQTSSLVFTLLPSNGIEAAAPPIVINDAPAHSQEVTRQQLALAAQQENLHRQFNWTLASLVALTVLIIQLFYLLSMQ